MQTTRAGKQHPPIVQLHSRSVGQAKDTIHLLPAESRGFGSIDSLRRQSPGLSTQLLARNAILWQSNKMYSASASGVRSSPIFLAQDVRAANAAEQWSTTAEQLPGGYNSAWTEWIQSQAVCWLCEYGWLPDQAMVVHVAVIVIASCQRR